MDKSYNAIVYEYEELVDLRAYLDSYILDQESNAHAHEQLDKLLHLVAQENYYEGVDAGRIEKKLNSDLTTW